MKGNKGSFKKGHKPVVHKDTLLKRSNSIKKFWKEHPEVLRKIIDATKTQITQKIIDKIISLYKKWNDGTKVARELHIGDRKIYGILKASNLSYGQGKNPSSRNGFKEGHIQFNTGRTHFKKGQHEGDKNPAKRLEVREKIKKKRAKQITPVKDTKIEVKIQNFLKQLEIEFFTHQYMNIKHAYQCDILIPVQEGVIQKTIIECDGDAFHFNPEIYNKEDKIFRKGMTAEEKWGLDKIRTKELIEKGFRVIRFWGSEIREMNIEKFENKLMEIKYAN